MLSETEGNAKLIHMSVAMFFSQQRTALIRQAKVYAGVSLLLQEAWQSPPQKTQLWCFLFEALDCNISLLPHFLPYYITVGEE